MKMFKKILALGVALCLVALCVALGFRIYIADHYPAESTKMVMTEALAAKYKEAGELKAYTQTLRFSYDDNKDGNFFAKEPIFLPDAEHAQITLRYNESTLKKVAEFYKLDSTPALADGLFRYRLCVSLGDGNYEYYDASYMAEYSRYFYRYAKLAFDGVDFTNAVWMRVEIFYTGEYEGKADGEDCFGMNLIYESHVSWGEETLENPLYEYRIPKGVLPE